MAKALKKAEKGGKRMKESDYLDVFENVCNRKTWERYVQKVIAIYTKTIFHEHKNQYEKYKF